MSQIIDYDETLIFGLVLSRMSILERLWTWYQDSRRLQPSSCILDRTHGWLVSNDRLWRNTDIGPCFVTNAHPRKAVDVILRQSKALIETFNTPSWNSKLQWRSDNSTVMHFPRIIHKRPKLPKLTKELKWHPNNPNDPNIYPGKHPNYPKKSDRLVKLSHRHN